MDLICQINLTKLLKNSINSFEGNLIVIPNDMWSVLHEYFFEKLGGV